MKALLLCAGLGTRLGVIGRGLPKALLPIGDEPLAAHTLRWLAAHGYREVGVNLHHHAEAIRETLKDGSSFGVRLEYRQEAELSGTAGAVRAFADFFADESEVLVVYGDLLIDQDLGALRAKHRATGAAATLLLHQRAGSNSLVACAEDGRITAFLERPSDAERACHPYPWVNSGVQILSRRFAALIPAHGPADLPRDLYMPHVGRERLYGVPLTGFRCAIDSPDRYAEARRAAAEGRYRRAPQSPPVAPAHTERRRGWRALVGFAVSALCLALTFRRVDLGALPGELARVGWWVLPLALALKLAQLACMAGRTQALARPVAALGFARAFRAVLVGFVGNSLLPVRMGELARAGYLARHTGGGVGACVAVVVVERLLDSLALCALFVALALGAARELPWRGTGWALGALGALALVGLAAFARWPARWIGLAERVAPRVGRELARFAAGLGALRDGGATLRGVAWTLCYWSLTLASIACWLTAFGLDLPAIAPAVVLLCLSFGAALPAAPGFVGTFHYAAAAALVFLGVEPTRAAAFAVVLHAVALLPPTLLGVAVLLPEWLGARRAAAPG